MHGNSGTLCRRVLLALCLAPALTSAFDDLGPGEPGWALDAPPAFTAPLSPAHTAHVLQDGIANDARLLQSGSEQLAIVQQWGTGNRASVEQQGSDQRVLIQQVGTGNQADVLQHGQSQTVRIEQVGDYQNARVTQVN